jgi:opacity protein-like surface antigen
MSSRVAGGQRDKRHILRLGYAQAKGELRFAGDTDSEKFRGTLYGIGVKQPITPNIAVVLEYQSLVLKSKTIDGVDFKPSANGVLIGAVFGF